MPLPISLFLIWLFFKGNWFPLYNQRFLLNSKGAQEISSILATSLIGYFIYIHLYLKDSLEEQGKQLLSFKDLIHFPIVILCRSCVIGVRYGFNSLEQMKMFKNSKTPAENYTYEFISDAITTNDVELIR